MLDDVKTCADLGWTSLLGLFSDQASADKAALLHQSKHHLYVGSDRWVCLSSKQS